MHRVRNLVRTHFDAVVMTAGSLAIGTWTLLRTFNGQANFDVIGQIGMAGQWQAGLGGEALIGATNYVLKMPLYTLVNLLPFEPFYKPLLLALCLNIATFLLLYLVLRRFARLAGSTSYLWPGIAALWFSVIAGRVLWANYANSRNLELVAALWVSYLVLAAHARSTSRRRLILITGLTSLTYFADPLSLYITAPPLIMLSAWHIWKPLQSRRASIAVSTSLLAGMLGAYLLKALIPFILPVSYLAAPHNPVSFSLAALQNIASGTMKLFDANLTLTNVSPTSLRQIVSVALLVSALTAMVISMRRYKPTLVHWFSLLAIFWTYCLYIMSGNAASPDTERYLVFVPLATFILLALVRIRHDFAVFICIGMITLIGFSNLVGTARAWSSRFEHDKPMRTVAEYTKGHPFVMTSLELAVPANYYTGYERTTVIPLVCTDNRIRTSNLFYANTRVHDIRTQPEVWLIVPQSGIGSGSNICPPQLIHDQFNLEQPIYELQGAGSVYYLSGEKAHQSLIESSK